MNSILRAVRFSALVFVALFLLGCSAKPKKPYVVMVSFDGFRYDYPELYDLENFQHLASTGSSAKGLIPIFPSKTFPNHYSLITGLRPDKTGMVDNRFYDADRDHTYSAKDSSDRDHPAYYGGLPLWQLAQQQGMKTASMFWFGGEATVTGMKPTYYVPYNESVSNEARIDQVSRWLQTDEEERPQFIALYFSLVDNVTHEYGTQSEASVKAIKEADRLLGLVMSSLKEVPLDINLVVVSDHGMMDVTWSTENAIVIDKLIDINDSSIHFANGVSHLHLYTKDTAALLDKVTSTDQYTVYRKADLPAQWHYNHKFTGDILLAAKPGNFFSLHQVDSTETATVGLHGYDPETSKQMQGMFFAAGPKVRKGIMLEPFENIHVYPFICQLLDLQIPEIDGDPEVLKPLIK